MDKLKADAARQIRNLFPDAGIRQVEKAVKQCYIGLVVAINTNERIKKQHKIFSFFKIFIA